MSFGDLLQESAGTPGNPGTLAHISTTQIKPGSSASLLLAGIAPVLILHQPAAALPHKTLKHHPCPRETAVLKLRTNNENLTLAPKGNANKSKPDRGYPTQGPGHQ